MAIHSAFRVVLTALLGPIRVASFSAEEAALTLDDACHSDSSGACALELLHLRAKASQSPESVALAQSEGKWCQKPAAKKLWQPSAEGGTVDIKILTYNLFWWNLFGVRGGNGNSAGHLIKKNMKDQPFDVMGFQECDDGKRVLEPVGLLAQYEMFQGDHAVCVAYRKDAWEELGKGTDDVGEDMGSHYYGKRGAVWMRLKHTETGRKMLFVNHHGPLEVNSGGQCGGASVANNLVHLMQQRAEPGDILILVGDFNANSASLTVQEMWSRMVLLHSGDSFGGVDNIFGNMDTSSIVSTETLGSGGSDHNAISAVVKVGAGTGSRRLMKKGTLPPSEASEAAKALTIAPPGDDWQHFWCGRLEDQTEYVVPEGGWSLAIAHNPGAGEAHDVAAPQRCCRLCQREKKCKSWMWVMWAGNGPLCKLNDALPTKKVANSQVVSGLSATTAAVLASKMAKKTAIASLDPVKNSAAVDESSDEDDAPSETGDAETTDAASDTPPETADAATASSSCKEAKPGETCYDEIMWARTNGFFAHPEWYPGLTASSSTAEFQKVVHANSPGKCPPPC